jgi:uncharacterized Zn finger protein
MEHLCAQRTGLFPTPAEIRFTCSCPDVAVMCKHVAAVLYGVGVRLDQRPELLFRLRQVDEKELVAHAGSQVPFSTTAPRSEKLLPEADLAELFGVELAPASPQAVAASPGEPPARRRTLKPRK